MQGILQIFVILATMTHLNAHFGGIPSFLLLLLYPVSAMLFHLDPNPVPMLQICVASTAHSRIAEFTALDQILDLEQIQEA